MVFLLPSLVRAGAETQTVNLVNGLDSGRFEKHLFVFESQLDQLDRVDRGSVSFHHCIRKHKYDVRPARQLARLIDERSVDIVHCTLQISLFVAWLALRFAKRRPRLVLALHGTLASSRRHEFFDRYLYPWLMRSCELVTCVCRAQEAHWQSRVPSLRGRTTVIYNGVDVARFSQEASVAYGRQLTTKLDLPAVDLMVCVVAGFRPEKGHGHLLLAFREVVAANANAYLLLAGDGPLRSEIEGLCVEYGIQRNVILLGSVPDVRAVLAVSDISVIPSTGETFSMAMLESMAMGVPVVMTDIGGAREAIRHWETGVLVQPGNSANLADAIMKLAGDSGLRRRMALGARETVVEKFTYQLMIQNTTRTLEGQSSTT